jgi:hypothetical protein
MYIVELFKCLSQLATSKLLYEEYISDLLKKTENKRTKKSSKLTSEYVSVKKRLDNKRIRTIEFKTKSQSNPNKVWTQKIQVPEYKDISKLKKNIDLTEKVELAIKAGNVKISCNCPDFLYKGYEWMADAGDYGINKQNIPPNIKNPELEGSVCKHLHSVLKNIDKFIPNIVKDWN